MHTILYIEDNEANRQLLGFILQTTRPDLRFLEATTGQTGLETAVKELPDIIFCDISLPDITGYDVLKRIRENTATRNTPVFAVSGNAALEDVERGMEAGFSGYLSKPISVVKILQTLDETITSLTL